MKISLVMAIKDPYRTKAYINRALSVSNLFNEVIVHSNCPENNEFIPNFNHMTILSSYSPITASEAFNECINKSTGDWILCHCDDDLCNILELNKIVLKIQKGDYNEYDVVFAPFYYGNEQRGWKLTPKQPEPINFESIAKKSHIPFTAFFKKSVWEEVKGFQNLPFNDWVFWLSAAKKNKKFICLDTPYFCWRYNHMAEQSLCDKECTVHTDKQNRKLIFDYLETI